ncbi:MAG: threonine--tRNA ligase [Candidatus Woesebacteria bacterium]
MSKPKPKQADNLHAMRHTAEHILTIAMQQLYGKETILPAMGPATDDGFYFDFDSPADFKLTAADFPKIEKRMKKLIQADLQMHGMKLDIAVAKKVFVDNQYKQEWLSEIEAKNEKASVYLTGSKEQLAADLKVLDELSHNMKKVKASKRVSAKAKKQQGQVVELKSFIDLCSGPHVSSTKEVKAIKLLSIAGAYWRGDEKNKMLTRVYGTAFNSQAELDEYLKMREEAEKRNHRRIGKELELFAVFPEIGQGLPVWLPRGYAMRRAIEDYMIQLERSYGYTHILTPHINRKELFETSGHLGFYDESMYPPLEFDNEVYYLKPMNCPAGMMVYKMKPRSYRDLPMKMGELGTVYRYEQSGELHGLQRVRGFTQNDAHIFCTAEQLDNQLKEVMAMLKVFYKDVGFDKYSFRLSLSDPKKDKYKVCGKREDWVKAEAALRKMLEDEGVEYEEAIGEAAFYGPKIDVQAINVFGKEDSISTIQVDFNLPERFDLNYINSKGEKERPFVIHRALVGSFERFFAFLIEHHAGRFPFWFAPVQVKVLPIADRHHDYAREVVKQLIEQKVRVELDDRSETLNAKIRSAQIEQVPYMLIVGDKEAESKSVNVRERDSGEQETVVLDKFIEKIGKED